ncbi:hypothetical protein Rsub_10409, partial [Raphidocelis subcapitata]
MEDMDHDACGDGGAPSPQPTGPAPLHLRAAELRVHEWLLQFGASKPFTSSSAEEIAAAV